jgi:hypothetical protein
MMCPVIDNPASCEIRAVISFLQAKSMSTVENRRELFAVYGQNVMSEDSVRQCVEGSKMGEQMFTIKSEAVGHL